VLLRRDVPASYEPWNRRWGAPHGHPVGRAILPHKLRSLPGAAQLIGPFGFQPNSDTRRLEYPWAFEALELAPGMRVVEVGGSNSGFQFVLDQAGCSVVNVDPSAGRVNFYCDVSPGEDLMLVRRTSLIQSTERDFRAFMADKSGPPVAGILNDCILRRLYNDKELSRVGAALP